MTVRNLQINLQEDLLNLISFLDKGVNEVFSNNFNHIISSDLFRYDQKINSFTEDNTCLFVLYLNQPLILPDNTSNF